MGHIQGGEVHQFKGAQLEAHLVFQDAVNGGEVAHRFAHDAQGLGAIAAPRMVDDEPWGVTGAHRGVAHVAGEGVELVANFAVGF